MSTFLFCFISFFAGALIGIMCMAIIVAGNNRDEIQFMKILELNKDNTYLIETDNIESSKVIELISGLKDVEINSVVVNTTQYLAGVKELKPENFYMIVLNDYDAESAERLSDNLKDFGIHAVIVDKNWLSDVRELNTLQS